MIITRPLMRAAALNAPSKLTCSHKLFVDEGEYAVAMTRLLFGLMITTAAAASPGLCDEPPSQNTIASAIAGTSPDIFGMFSG
jgi:hypothetical protein